MPGFNGTGPRGTGPMTGGRRGFCATGTRTQFYPYGGFRRTSEYGMGPGFYSANPVVPPVNREQELGMLKNQAQAMQDQLEQIKTRIEQLGSDE